MNKLISKKTVIESSQYVKRNNMEQKFGKILEEEKDEVVINLEWALSLMERQE